MFFSVNDLHNYSKNNYHITAAVRRGLELPYNTRVTKKHFALYVRQVKEAIRHRHTEIGDGYDALYIGKWYRPWDVVPKLRTFAAPNGQYAVGVEIELGFTSRNAAMAVAEFLSNWRHVALDYEGGTNPIEATFPPSLYSKFGPRSQPVRYLKWLKDNEHLVASHREDALVGIHVNVSRGHSPINDERLRMVNMLMDSLSDNNKRKYFGRTRPYRYGNSGSGRFIEFKMFNSTTDWKRLRQYVDIGVAVADLVYGRGRINQRTVVEALEAGYNKRKRTAKVSSPEAQSNLALAA